jgi:prepilin-type N-terminal cleavage/methylation domain-containing protein/prepilin-type processing-associated H-X9-DG protein
MADSREISRLLTRPAGFTLLELLVVISIISLLVSITLPSLSMARQRAQAATCLANLHHLGLAMGMYHANNNGSFWRCTTPDSPRPGTVTYFWGTNTDPVDTSASPLLKYTNHGLELFWCQALPWGSYVPQGSVSEATTTYAYNSWYLDPASYRWDFSLRPRTISQIPDPSALFVFNDAATLDVWGAGGVLKNSTHMEPPQETYVPTPTAHFRHEGRSNALCADGHAAAFGLEGADMALPEYDLGFVGRQNEPHYQQK